MILERVIKFLRKQVRSVLLNKGNFSDGSGKLIILSNQIRTKLKKVHDYIK